MKNFFDEFMSVVGDVGEFVANAVTLYAFSSLSKSGSSSSANVTNSTNMANSTLTGSSFGDSILEHAIGSGIDFGYNYLAAQLSNETAQANAKYWANYNSPVNQMQRLKEAGLNPNMVYGNGSATTTYEGNADAPQIHGVNTRMLYSAEMANLRADVENKQRTSENIAAQTKVHEKEAQLKDIEIRERLARDPEKYGKSLLDLNESELQNRLEQNLKIYQETQGYVLSNEYQRLKNITEEVSAQWHKENGGNLLTSQYENLLIKNVLLRVEAAYSEDLKKGELRLQRWQVNKISSEMALMAVQSAELRALKEKYEAETETEKKRKLQTAYSAAENKFKAMEQKYRTLLISYGMNPDATVGFSLDLLGIVKGSMNGHRDYPEVVKGVGSSDIDSFSK